MDGIDAAALAVTNQVLGEGEVSVQIAGERRFRIQESVFTGLWRCLEVDAQGRLVQDWLEAAAMPQVAIDAARAASADGVAKLEVPSDAMNSPALLAEITSQLAARSPGALAHSINLTLLPMTPADHVVLERALPVGPVAIMSRAFGNCRVTSTSTRDVWRVQYFNSMNTLILNTIEVVEMPEAAIASAQDLLDTRTRLAELVEWMGEACAEPRDPRPDRSAQTSASCTWARSLSKDSATTARSGRRRGSSARSAGPCTTRPRVTRCGRCRPARLSIACRRTGPARPAQPRASSSW